MADKPNKLERLKAELAPADFSDRLAALDWNAVDEAQRFYLKSYGIYNIKMRPDRYMLRLRIDGGRMSLRRLEVIGGLAQEYGVAILVTARAQIELHGIAPEEIYPLYHRLLAAGITTHQTLTDNFRALVTDPYDGMAVDSQIECYPMIEAIRERILDRPEWMGTIPRKFNTAIIGRVAPLVNPWGNDLLFALAQWDGVWGFNVYLGGKNNEVAQSVDVFVLPDEVPDLFMAVAEVFSEHGLRESRAKIRMFHLIESVGMEKIRLWIVERLGRPLRSAGELKMVRSVPLNVTELAGGGAGQILPAHYGEMTPEALMEQIRIARESGGEIRLGSDQNLHRIGGHETSVESRPQITACAGARHCPLSLWDIKHDVPTLPLARLERLGITVGFSGCLKGCGRHYHSDIGLFGLRTNLYGETERAVRVYLGAIQSFDPAPGRMLYYSVPERAMEALLGVILDEYERSLLPSFEAYAHHIRRYSIEWLQLWYLLHLNGRVDADMQAAFVAGVEEVRLAAMASEKFANSFGTGYADAIRELSHRVWDQKA